MRSSLNISIRINQRKCPSRREISAAAKAKGIVESGNVHHRLYGESGREKSCPAGKPASNETKDMPGAGGSERRHVFFGMRARRNFSAGASYRLSGLCGEMMAAVARY